MRAFAVLLDCCEKDHCASSLLMVGIVDCGLS